MPAGRVIVVGAGVAGLAAAIDLATAGVAVTVLERADRPGGKMAGRDLGTRAVDDGPTVLTMRGVLDALFERAGARLDDHVALAPARLLARHAWREGETLDLPADVRGSADAIGRFAGAAEASGFLAMSEDARRVHDHLERTFVARPQAGLAGLLRESGVRGLGALALLRPFSTLDRVLARHFRDPRLRQLFGRYATYCGSSPFLAPGPLLMIVHTERGGVWLPAPGMHALAAALARLAGRAGATIRCGARVEAITVARGRASGVTLEGGEAMPADAVVVTADAQAVASGAFGTAAARGAAAIRPGERSLSALTWTGYARPRGFALARHNVFFSRDSRAEFDALFGGRRMPRDPTVYVCAQDRGDDALAPPGAERLLVLVNAPADGDTQRYGPQEVEACEQAMRTTLARCGLSIEAPEAWRATTPADFAARYPATGGALYGRAMHGWRAAFRRPGSRTAIPGLALAGGSVHPGAGVPMAALSGRLAAQSVLRDLTSRARSAATATRGGTPTRSPTTDGARSS